MIVRLPLLAGMLGLASGLAAAAPLDNEACNGLKADYARLDTPALKADMEKGSEWAKTNLPPERLKEIRAFLELEEQINFRCPQLRVLVPKSAAVGVPRPAVAGPGKPGTVADTDDDESASATAPGASDLGGVVSQSLGAGPANAATKKAANPAAKPKTAGAQGGAKSPVKAKPGSE